MFTLEGDVLLQTQVPKASTPTSPPAHARTEKWAVHVAKPVGFRFLQFLGLTEEDLNKYDLTQGAKKKLKTQLELQKSFE